MNRLLVLLVCLAVVAAGCSKDTSPVSPSSTPAGKATTDLFSLFAESGNALVGVDADTTASADADTALTPEQARVELTRQGIAYTATAFADSARSGNLVVVKLFVQSGMSVNVTNNNDYTPLHMAARYGYLEVVKYLVGQGADVDATDYNGWTLLHWAAWGGYLEIVEYLVGQGADVDAMTNGGSTPRDLAGRGHTAVVDYFDSL